MSGLSTQQAIDRTVREIRGSASASVPDPGRAAVVEIASFRRGEVGMGGGRTAAIVKLPVRAVEPQDPPPEQDMMLWEAEVDSHGTEISPQLAQVLADKAYDQGYPLVAFLRKIAAQR